MRGILPSLLTRGKCLMAKFYRLRRVEQNLKHNAHYIPRNLLPTQQSTPNGIIPERVSAADVGALSRGKDCEATTNRRGCAVFARPTLNLWVYLLLVNLSGPRNKRNQVAPQIFTVSQETPLSINSNLMGQLFIMSGIYSRRCILLLIPKLQTVKLYGRWFGS